jgi:hypothetical protein
MTAHIVVFTQDPSHLVSDLLIIVIQVHAMKENNIFLSKYFIKKLIWWLCNTWVFLCASRGLACDRLGLAGLILNDTQKWRTAEHRLFRLNSILVNEQADSLCEQRWISGFSSSPPGVCARGTIGVE